MTNEQDQKNQSDILNLLYGILFGAFGVGLLLSGALGATALTLIVILLALIFLIVRVIPGMKLFYVIGLIAGGLIVIVFRQLSPAGLEPVQLLLVIALLKWLGR